jgi:hypothetical protein
MVNVNNGALRGLGGRCNISSVGGSVALVDKAGCSALSPHHHHGATARGVLQGQCGKSVHNQIEPQQLDCLEDALVGAAVYSRHDSQTDCGDVDCELKLVFVNKMDEPRLVGIAPGPTIPAETWPRNH